MRIVAAIPTRNADYSGSIIKWIYPHVDEVIVGAQGSAIVNFRTPSTKVFHRPAEWV